jgi:hypothetical protein
VAGYEWEQLRKALDTAETSDEPAVRQRALARADRWIRVLTGIATGRIKIGSRNPVKNFPVWLTPEIVRGGFATGAAAAAGPLQADEIALAKLVNVRPSREDLFAWFLSPHGLRELDRMLDVGDYRLELPENGALLTVAYLLRQGMAAEAERLIGAIEPWSGQVRFWPLPSDDVDLPGVHVATVPDVAKRLAAKRPRLGIEVEREALAVWVPFTDRVLEHWWLTRSFDGEVGKVFPDGWSAEAERLALEYGQLAVTHTKTTKHRDPGENLQILLRGMREAVNGRFDEAVRRRVSAAVANMIAKRGEPDSAEMAALRSAQSRTAQSISHASLAHDAAERLRVTGVKLTADPLSLLDGAPGMSLRSVRSVVKQATHAPVSDLLQSGVLRSAEMLSELAPQLTAATVAGRYEDPIAGRLAKRVYLAFANRRSVLLLNHESQVTVSAIPWFEALEDAASDDRGAGLAKAQAIELASLGMRYFPGTPVPNSMVRELTRILASAGQDAPLTYELASDIFMGSFSPVFQRAAQVAANVVEGTLYSRYYGIDYSSISRLGTVSEVQRYSKKPRVSVPMFNALVLDRAGVKSSGWLGVAVNGTIIEQAQILTTHNLAQLVQIGVHLDWIEQARAAWRTTRAHLSKAAGSKPLHHRKNAAFAWRQAVFYLSLSSTDEVNEFLAGTLTLGASSEVSEQCEQILDGLRAVVTESRTAPDPFLGWVATDSA